MKPKQLQASFGPVWPPSPRNPPTPIRTQDARGEGVRLVTREATACGARRRRGGALTLTATATTSHPTSALSATFSPIVPAIPRIGEDEPPPSWDFVLTPKAMVGRGSPKLSMIPKGSPKFGRMLSAASTRMKTVSPQSILAKKTASSPKGNQVKQRAIWNAELEKSLVEILFEYKVNGCRGDNGWTTKGWNRMVKEFHAGNKCVSFTKNQVQEEGQLKRDYKMLKAVRQQSGSSWNEKRCMVEGSPAMWQNLQIISGFTFAKIKKFRNNKASFPLYDALGELYDGHLAEGKHNCTSFDSMEDEKPLRLVQELEDDSQEQDDVVLLEEPKKLKRGRN
uniref:Myb/SANT-like domain-containing protein n=1 Tax=Oryza barthii TaxID=65489 RepID=A0A0D3HL52_9ORYZ